MLECVAELPEVYQSALRLHYWMGASVAEAAALLDVPDNTLKVLPASRPAPAARDARRARFQVSEQDHVDRRLREAMAADEPRLSSAFDARLARRLEPRRLTPTARLEVLAYIVAAVAVSVLAMRTVELDSRIVVATMVGTLAATAVYGPEVHCDGEVNRVIPLSDCDVHDLRLPRASGSRRR